MTSNTLRFPNALVVCASSLLCAAVLALQNAEQYAAKMEAPLQAVSEALLGLPDALRGAGEATRGTWLNSVEKEQLAELSAVISPGAAAGDEDLDDAAEVEQATAEEPLPVAADVEMPAAEPAADAETPAPAEPVLAVEPVAEVDAAASPESPAVDSAEEAAEPQEVAAARETVPACESRWGSLISAAPAARPLFPALQPAAQPTPVAEAQLAQEPAPQEELAQPEPVPQEEPAQPEPAPQEEPAPQSPQGESLPPVEAAAAVPVSVEESGLTQAPPMRYRIMMVGDSLMEDLGPRTHRTFNRRKGLEFVVSAKFSTGLCRPDFFNWPAHMQEVISTRKPNLVIFFIGANDGLSVKEGKSYVPTGSAEWRQAYGRKMDEVVTIAREAGAEVIWVELPAVGGRYNKLLHETQKAQREYCESHGVLSLQTDPLFSGEWGKFEAYGSYKGKTVRLRRQDSTHLTPDGNMKVVDALQPIMERKMIEFYLQHPEQRLSDEEVAKIKSVPAIYTCQYTPSKKKKVAPRTRQ